MQIATKIFRNITLYPASHIEMKLTMRLSTAFDLGLLLKMLYGRTMKTTMM